MDAAKEPRDGEQRSRHGGVRARLRDWAGGTRRVPGRMRNWVRRARDTAGYERDTALLLAKSALAGVVSWAVADGVFASPQATYAPFTALLVVQSTVYRTLLQSAQYLAAVLLGVLAAALTGSFLQPALVAFAVMLVVGLLGGRWNRLGAQGAQVPVIGIFAFNSLSGGATGALTDIVGMVVLGAAVGVLSNLLLLPPMRYRDAEQGVRELASALHTLLCDMSEGLREGVPSSDTADDWVRRTAAMDGTARKARQAVEHGAESVSYNPRRLLSRRHPTTFEGCRTAVECLERASEQVRSIARGVQHASDGGEREPGGGADRRPETPGSRFLRSYARLLEVTAAMARDLGRTADGKEDRDGRDEESGDGEYAALERHREEGRRRYGELAEEIEERPEWPAGGALLIDAERLMQEFDRVQHQGSPPPPHQDGG
ncbi:FUSC family protein [Streptomyces sp. HNM0574]|uniref:FUSC family protein n=1 Tax=Streptomyces sp. HNM0574 TaxID=2714954 RepID=UPI0014699ED6|nr:FUSC family protein [Streptomyces sp. HNM0574]NLU67832.1 FUSC family protein [Streptomyces sp. HNM0574]